MSTWQPIESAPKDGTLIAVRFSNGWEHNATWRNTYGGEWHVDSFEFAPYADQRAITNWRPLPEPPK
ncbi:DUF551 domain-containing protein [Xanthomonas citri]|uniref:DUF551 domain-containing protein n=1 Tax=Xanthomonas citri TaxID=346 RepID=UPI00103C71F3